MTGMTDDDRRIHPSPFREWYATQDASSRGVWLCDRASDKKVKAEPPTDWEYWSWNVTEDGMGIYFKRVRD